MTANVDTITRIEGSLADGGWTAEGTVINDADRLSYYQGVQIWYDMNINGNWYNQAFPAFRGHLVPKTWEKRIQTSILPWRAILGQEIIKQGQVQGIFYKHVASSPANRHQIINMNYAKIIYEMIGGHCNLMAPTEASRYDSSLWSGAFTTQTHTEGFFFLNLDTTNSTSVDHYLVREGNFWDRLKEIAEIEFFLVYFDKYNTLHYIPHPMFGVTLPDPVLTLTSSLLLQPLRIERRNTEEVGQVRLYGTTPQGFQISGKYPVDPTPGPIVNKGGYLATSSSQMTTIATRMYKFSNRDFRVEAQLPGAIGLRLDLLDRVGVTYTSNVDGIAWNNKKFWIDRIVVEIMSNQKARTTLVMDAEAA